MGSAWQDQGDVIDIKWATLEDKPSSLVANIDDAVSKRHSQNTDKYLDTQISKYTRYVDGNRTDSYTADGSITKPYKTIQAAINSITVGVDENYVVLINAKVYIENITLKSNVQLLGLSNQVTIMSFAGDTITGDTLGTVQLKNLNIFNFGSGIALKLNAVVTVQLDGLFINYFSGTSRGLVVTNCSSVNLYNSTNIFSTGDTLTSTNSTVTILNSNINSNTNNGIIAINSTMTLYQIAIASGAGKKDIDADATSTLFWGSVDCDLSKVTYTTRIALIADILTKGDLYVKSGGKISDGTDEATIVNIKDAVDKKHDKLHEINNTLNHLGISGSGIEDNFMALDTNGLPKNSGKSAIDFANASHNHLEEDITDLNHYDSEDFGDDFGLADLANLATKSYNDLTDKPDLSDLHYHDNKVELDLVTDGNHDVRIDNPHIVTVDQLDLASGTVAFDIDDAINHKDLTNNPHTVTSAQVGAYTQAEVNTLVNKAKCIEITLSGNANNYLFTKGAIYAVLTSFVFKGTTLLGSPTNIKAIVHVKTALKPGDVRVYDLTNANTICEATGISSLVPIIVDLGTLSNLPSGEVMFEVQAKCPLADEVYVSGLIIEF